MKPYAYIVLPYNQVKEKEVNQEKSSFSFGALKSATISIMDSPFKSISKAISSLNSINSKYSIVAMTQLLKKGKITNTQALNYFCTGFANQLGFSWASIGYQSVDAMKEAMTDGKLNTTQFLTSLAKLLDTLSYESVSREENIIIDAVLGETPINRVIEVAERRVESGQTLTEFVHNMPETIRLDCAFYGINYTWQEFQEYINNLIDKKITVKLQLGEDLIEDIIITNLDISRNEATTERLYSIEFKKISVGTIEIGSISTALLNTSKKTAGSPNVVDDPTNPTDETKLKKTMLLQLTETFGISI